MVPPPGGYTAYAMAMRPPAGADAEGLGDTLRRLWRHRVLILCSTALAGGVAAFVAWSMPSYYVSEARVLVGIQAPRVLNVESIVTDISPDAERVQNEGLILQSRGLARQVIAQLRLQTDPEFNAALRKPSVWSRIDDTRRGLTNDVIHWLGFDAAIQPDAISALPDAKAEPSMGLKLQMRYSIPLFVYGQGIPTLNEGEHHALANTHQLNWRVIQEEGKPALEVRNQGNVHVRLSQVAVEQGGQKRTVAEGLLGYVLPGSTRSWPLPAGIYQPNRMSAQINARDTQWQSTPVN